MQQGNESLEQFKEKWRWLGWQTLKVAPIVLITIGLLRETPGGYLSGPSGGPGTAAAFLIFVLAVVWMHKVGVLRYVLAALAALSFGLWLYITFIWYPAREQTTSEITQPPPRLGMFDDLVPKSESPETDLQTTSGNREDAAELERRRLRLVRRLKQMQAGESLGVAAGTNVVSDGPNSNTSER